MSAQRRFLTAVLLGGLVAFVSTLPLWVDGAENWDLLLVFSLPGVLVALPLGVMGIAGNMHDPNTVVTGLVDGVFYTWLFYWLMKRRLRSDG